MKFPTPLTTLALLIVAATSCSSPRSNDDNHTTGRQPILKNLIINFAPYDTQTGKAGDFIFAASRNKVFDEFGATVPGENGETKVLPTFEYKVDPHTQIFSPMDGIVSQIDYQETTQDFSIVLVPEIGSDWLVNIDHVTDVAIAVGDQVTAGQPIGKPGGWDATFGRTELMVVQDHTYICPFSVFDTELKNAYEAKVTQLMDDWEAFKEDTTIYDQAAMVVPGCNAYTLTD